MDGIKSSLLQTQIEQIERQSKVMVDAGDRPFRLDEPVPILTLEQALEPSPWLQPDAGEVDEASFISGLFEGVAYPIGEQRRQAYLQQKEAAQRIGGRRHA